MTNSGSRSSDSSLVSNANGDEVSVPSRFICPITLQVMVHPLMTRTGLNFERDAILNWLERGSGNCPLTRKPMTASDLIPNHQLETQIRFWHRNNDIPFPPAEDMVTAENPSKLFVGFLTVSQKKKEEILGRLPPASSTITLESASLAYMSTGPNQPSSRSSLQRMRPPQMPGIEENPRREGDRRRTFLSRILISAVRESESLQI